MWNGEGMCISGGVRISGTNGLEKCGPAADCGLAVGCGPETCGGGWLNASATTLAVPDVWRKSDVIRKGTPFVVVVVQTREG